MNDKKHFRQWLRRKKQGMTYNQISGIIGGSVSYAQQVFNEGKSVSQERMIDIMKALGASTDEIREVMYKEVEELL